MEHYPLKTLVYHIGKGYEDDLLTGYHFLSKASYMQRMIFLVIASNRHINKT
jgi:hypothetical protein